MVKLICPHCEKDLWNTKKIARREDIVKCTNGGSAKIIGKDPVNSFTFALITCPFCNKILGAVNSSPIPIPKG